MEGWIVICVTITLVFVAATWGSLVFIGTPIDNDILEVIETIRAALPTPTPTGG